MSTLHSAVTAVTHSIPNFLREPAEALIGERCYSILVYDFDITHGECLKYALSKGLGFGIVLGGAIVKIPQIITIISSGSARGLSLSAYILETASYAISLAYASRSNFPFSTYGENFFLTIQNVIITLLIMFFSRPKGSVGPKRPLSSGSPRGSFRRIIPGILIVVAAGTALWSESLCPPGLLSLLQASTLPLSLLSKTPQIISNHQNRSTGNLSAFAVFNALLGCCARLYTTRTEVNDPIIFWGFAGAALLNLVLAAQMVAFWPKEPEVVAYSHTSSTGGGLRRESVAEEHVLEAPTKPFGETSGTPERRWARKLD